MQLKSNKIKSMNDFICGCILGGFGIWLMLSDKITEGRILKAHDQGFIRPDTYIRMIGGLIILLAIIIVLRSINFRKEGETKAFGFPISKESLLTYIALGFYILFLQRVGFAVSTFVFTFFIVTLYMRKETAEVGFSGRQKILRILFSAGFSAAIVLFVYLIFTKVLLVMLP